MFRLSLLFIPLSLFFSEHTFHVRQLPLGDVSEIDRNTLSVYTCSNTVRLLLPNARKPTKTRCIFKIGFSR